MLILMDQAVQLQWHVKNAVIGLLFLRGNKFFLEEWVYDPINRLQNGSRTNI